MTASEAALFGMFCVRTDSGEGISAFGVAGVLDESPSLNRDPACEGDERSIGVWVSVCREACGRSERGETDMNDEGAVAGVPRGDPGTMLAKEASDIAVPTE